MPPQFFDMETPPLLTSHFSSRRAFLTGASSLALSGLLTSCARQNRPTLAVQLLKGSVPPQILNQFRKFLKQKPSLSNAVLDFTPETQLEALFTLLQTWQQVQTSAPAPSWLPFSNQKPPKIAELVTLGDYWLEKAIQQRLIQPLDPKSLPNWTQLPSSPDWRSLVTRNRQGQLDPKGDVWGAPYLWGSTVIAYRQDIFKEKGLSPPTDWRDLWRSDLSRQISLLDQPREVIGLTLKKLGKSYNTPNLEAVPSLKAELAALQQQVKFYSSDAYLQPLLLGDTWLAVGWSTDFLPVLQRSQNISVVVPTSGTALWADLWVSPAANQSKSALVNEWINFCWQPEIASQLSLLSRASSPIISAVDRASLPADLRNNPVLVPDAATLQKSEFLQPLPSSTLEQYRSIWQVLRQAG